MVSLTPLLDWRRAETEALPPILAAALDAFHELGYHGTSVRDIARRCGLTVPALYYHYGNKEGLLVALLDHSITSVIERCQTALDEAGAAPGARLTNLVECLVLYMARHGKFASMDAEIRALSPENRRRYGAQRRQVEEMLTAVITAGVAQGEFSVTSPADTARALLGMIQALPTWYRPGGRISAPALAARYLDIIQHTVGAR